MTESLLSPTGVSGIFMDMGSALALREEVHAWKEEQPTPEKAYYLKLLIERALFLAKGLQSAWSLCSQEGSVWETRSYSRRVEAVEFLAMIVEDILTRSQEILTQTREKYPGSALLPVEIEPDPRSAKEIAAKAHELLMWLKRAEPPADEEMIRRSREGYDRGEGESVGDIIARLKSGGPLVKE